MNAAAFVFYAMHASLIALLLWAMWPAVRDEFRENKDKTDQ
jgi:hypothetical protein